LFINFFLENALLSKEPSIKDVRTKSRKVDPHPGHHLSAKCPH